MSRTDSLLVDVIARDKSTVIINNIGKQYTTLTDHIDHAGRQGESMWGRIGAGAAGTGIPCGPCAASAPAWTPGSAR